MRRKRKELIAERKHPGDPEPEWCSPGSIEQQLDMCEKGSLRGDDILHGHGRDQPAYTGNPREFDLIMNDNWEMDFAEEDREGDEMSGDEHSSGMEGGESEQEGQPHISSGLPGDRTRREDQEIRSVDPGHLEEEEREIPLAPQSTVIPIRKKR